MIFPTLTQARCLVSSVLAAKVAAKRFGLYQGKTVTYAGLHVKCPQVADPAPNGLVNEVDSIAYLWRHANKSRRWKPASLKGGSETVPQLCSRQKVE